MQKERERALNVYKNVPSSDLQKKERRKSPFESLSGFSSAGFSFDFRDASLLLWNRPSSLENDKQLRTEDTDGFSFLVLKSRN